MITAVTEFVLPALFLSSGALAASSLVLGWRHYGAQFHALRAELAGLSETRDLLVRMSTVEVREVTPITRRSRVRLVDRPAPPAARKRSALRVAA